MYILYSMTTLLIIILIMIKINERSNRKEGFTSGFTSFAGINSNSDTPWTIEKATKLVITDILRKIINQINTKTGMSYVFTAYDQLGQEVLCPKRTKFTADIFLHEMRNLETRRMIVIFVVNFATKQVDIEYINLSNAFKLPEKQFMDHPSPELILQDDNLLRNEYHIMGLNNSKIEFSILRDEQGRPKQIPTPTEFNKWILPLGIDQASQNPQALFPSRRQSTCWDSNGANYIEAQTKLKMGVNNSPMIKMPYIYDNPTINRQKEWNTDYKGMFDLVDSAGNGRGRGVASSP
jgi:hypothetical protein